MLASLLIANRGEIACRVIRTARRLGLRTIAVHSDADQDALHVAMADEAWRIGPAPAAASYLDAPAILDAARRSGAAAIHPGYGFLAENAAFAEAVAAAGIVFVGPPPAAIRAMGGKSEAKARMAEAGVPLVPGYHGAGQDPARLAAEAARIGWPVLIKASAGGGGKGMKVAAAAAEFQDQLASAGREAKAAFGDGRLLLEKYLQQPRHVEVQVFADRHGHCVYLLDRDCSIQRRHQKVVEEAPAPDLPAATRRAMGEAAVAAARAIGYEGAGTVEFLLDRDGAFYFMEMNTRLQVEHPVTELVTGQDLVEWQLRVAAGEPLPLGQDAIRARGHAIEVRLYAEDPDRDFLPQTGRLRHLRFPEPGPHARIDTGVRSGDAITVHYDPLIAKLIVWDEDRAAAVRRLQTALAATEVAGLVTNLRFLQAVAQDEAFAAAELDTGFIERHRGRLLPPPAAPTAEALALATLGLLLDRARRARAVASRTADPWSPWATTRGWRLNETLVETFAFGTGTGIDGPAVRASPAAEGWRLELPDGTALAAGGHLDEGGRLAADLGSRRLAATWLRHAGEIDLFAGGEACKLALVEPLAAALAQEAASSRVQAPMPGKVTAILVEPGATVTRGQPLLVLEAMKMEHTLKAPADGTVTLLRCAVGDLVEEGVELVGFEAAP